MGKKPAQKRGESHGFGGLYGIRPVQEALRSRKRTIANLYLKSGPRSERLRALQTLADKAGIGVAHEDAADLERRCGSNAHQGAVLLAGALPVKSERECLAAAAHPRALLVALDEVEDPQNFGAIVRSCSVFGATGVVIPRRHSAALSAAASKSSAGTLETFPIFEVANLSRFLNNAAKSGYWIAGTAEDAGQPLPGFRREGALILVVGNEGRGLRPLVGKQCDLMLSIPTAGSGSLNVSNATAVLLYHLQLGAQGG